MTDSSFPSPLVSTAWLAAHLDDPSFRILDASTYLPNSGRDARAEFATAHIPGAQFADIGWLSDEHAPFPHTMLPASTFAERIGALGVGNGHRVVVYDGSGQNFSAPRLWWMLRVVGHEQVAVLDGGLPKWQRDGYAATTDVTAVEPTSFHASVNHAQLRKRVRSLADMRDNLASHAAQVVDARSAGRFEATEPEPRAGVRGGHIPGSANVHYASLVNADGTMRSREELKTIMHTAGLDLAQPIVASCGTGITACAVVLALDVLGVHNTAVFDGSWTEWGSTTDVPVETGPSQLQRKSDR